VGLIWGKAGVVGWYLVAVGQAGGCGGGWVVVAGGGGGGGGEWGEGGLRGGTAHAQEGEEQGGPGKGGKVVSRVYAGGGGRKTRAKSEKTTSGRQATKTRDKLPKRKSAHP